jgi:hypothetical protein
MLSSHLHLGLPSGLLPSGLPTKMLYAPVTSPMRATCPSYLILLALITLTILGKESGSYGILIFVLRVFILRAVLEERIKLVNRGITVFATNSKNNVSNSPITEFKFGILTDDFFHYPSVRTCKTQHAMQPNRWLLTY